MRPCFTAVAGSELFEQAEPKFTMVLFQMSEIRTLSDEEWCPPLFPPREDSQHLPQSPEKEFEWFPSLPTQKEEDRQASAESADDPTLLTRADWSQVRCIYPVIQIQIQILY